MAGQYALPQRTPLAAGAPRVSPSAAAAHQLLDQPVGVLVAKFAPQYANRIPPEKAKQTFREALKTSDFMTKSFILSIVGQHLPKGVTVDDISKAVNEPPPAAQQPAATAAAPATAAPATEAAAPAAAAAAPAATPAPTVEDIVAGTAQPEVQAGAGPAAVAAATAAPSTAPATGGGRATITPELMRAIRQIESGGNQNARTGSYKGLYQLSDSEFSRLGGRGSIFDPKENERIAALKLQQEANQVAKKLGRDLTPGEIYLVHQQGVGGSYEHLTNPGRPAWQSMHATGEGRNKGEKWSRLAIWGNVPDKDKARYGNVENLTSGEFAKMWSDRIARGGGSAGSTEPPPLDPTPNVGAGESKYTADAEVEAAKSMTDPTPNVGSGASDYTPAAETPSEVAGTLGKNKFGSSLGDALKGFGAMLGGGAGKGSTAASGPTTVAPAQLPTPPGIQPIVDPRAVEAQRQQLAMAMQRLNSGKLF
jgi:Transglycosylase SLT domain